MKTLVLFTIIFSLHIPSVQAQVIGENSDLIPESGEIVKNPGFQTMQQGEQSLQHGEQAIQDGQQASPNGGLQTIHHINTPGFDDGSSVAVAYGPKLSFARNDIKAVGKTGDVLKALYNQFRETRTNIYYILSLKPDHKQALKLEKAIQQYEKDFKEISKKKHPSDEEVKSLKIRRAQIEAELNALAEELNISLPRIAVLVTPSPDTDKSLFKSVDSSGNVKSSSRGSPQDKRGSDNSTGAK